MMAKFDFADACSEGQLKKAKKLLLKHPDKITISEMEFGFRKASLEGHANVVEWILSVNPEVVSIIKGGMEDLFYAVCSQGHLDIAKILLTLKPDIDTTMDNENPFVGACVLGHLELAKWLLSVRPDTDISFVTTGNARTKILYDVEHDDVEEWLKQVMLERETK